MSIGVVIVPNVCTITVNATVIDLEDPGDMNITVPRTKNYVKDRGSYVSGANGVIFRSNEEVTFSFSAGHHVSQEMGDIWSELDTGTNNITFATTSGRTVTLYNVTGSASYSEDEEKGNQFSIDGAANGYSDTTNTYGAQG